MLKLRVNSGESCVMLDAICIVAWRKSSSKYVQSAVQNVQEYLTSLPGGKTRMKKVSAPFAGGYTP
jgi:hypothetical protein